MVDNLSKPVFLIKNTLLTGKLKLFTVYFPQNKLMLGALVIQLFSKAYD